MKCMIAILLATLLLLGGCGQRPSAQAPQAAQRTSLAEDVRAMWISQFDLSLMCLTNGQARPREDFETRAILMVSKLKMIGINTVFLQARPNADALYPSSLFPPSSYAVGKEIAPFTYDPFGILIEACQAGEISVHAWINPLRAMRADDPRAANTEYPVGTWLADSSTNGTYVVEVGGTYYLNPAYAEVRALICAGAEEILKQYPVDGIHIDDYFYPTTDPSFDATAFEANGNGNTLGDFRRAQTEALVASLSQTARAYHKLFGVSPSGNMRRNFEELYADVESCCENGYLDYLCPQIYFGLEHETFPFATVCAEFDALASKSNIPLLVGITLEKAANASVGGEDIYAGGGKREWIENRDVLARCLAETQNLPSCRGVALFSYRLLFSPENGSENEAVAEECERFLPAFKTMDW